MKVMLWVSFIATCGVGRKEASSWACWQHSENRYIGGWEGSGLVGRDWGLKGRTMEWLFQEKRKQAESFAKGGHGPQERPVESPAKAQEHHLAFLQKVGYPS